MDGGAVKTETCNSKLGTLRQKTRTWNARKENPERGVENQKRISNFLLRFDFISYEENARVAIFL